MSYLIKRTLTSNSLIVPPLELVRNHWAWIPQASSHPSAYRINDMMARVWDVLSASEDTSCFHSLLTPRCSRLSPFFSRVINMQSFSNALSPLPPSWQPPPAFRSHWLAWDLLPHLSSWAPFLGVWVSSPSFLLPWLRNISLHCF